MGNVKIIIPEQNDNKNYEIYKWSKNVSFDSSNETHVFLVLVFKKLFKNWADFYISKCSVELRH